MAFWWEFERGTSEGQRDMSHALVGRIFGGASRVFSKYIDASIIRLALRRIWNVILFLHFLYDFPES